MNDHEAETLAHAVSNSDDLCLPSNPDQALKDMVDVLTPPPPPPGIVEVCQYKQVSLKGYKLGQDDRKISGRRLLRGRNQRIIDLYEAGNTPAEIAEMVNRTVERVRQIIRRGY